jgi:hypothetical protein
MEKQKKSEKKILKFLRELAVIVIGIIITVGLGLWVNNNNIKKEQQQYFNAIILELNENAENFNKYAIALQKSIRYSNYLRSYDEKSLSLDSVRYYGACYFDSIGWGEFNKVILYCEDAFEMFKSSGSMRHVNDKKLLLSIWKVYYSMKNTQNMIHEFIQYKKDIALMDIQKMENGEQVVAPRKMFYLDNLPQVMVDGCEGMAELIRETISELEKSKIVNR